ncbi:MAG: hypothetical protein K0S65_5686 [Labilithrix sp.]|nr:hypothetical protein [Labilithrix sp.]
MREVARNYLEAFAAAARSGGRPLRGRAAYADDVIFTFHHDRVEPERFVMHTGGRWEVTVPARQLATTEIAGEYAFVGAKLVIVVADGTRTAFKLDVPKDLDRSVPPMVSGFWTARSGQRFASILRVGQRVLRFDNDGSCSPAADVRRDAAFDSTRG